MMELFLFQHMWPGLSEVKTHDGLQGQGLKDFERLYRKSYAKNKAHIKPENNAQENGDSLEHVTVPEHVNMARCTAEDGGVYVSPDSSDTQAPFRSARRDSCS